MSWPAVAPFVASAFNPPDPFAPIQFWDSPAQRTPLLQSRFLERFGTAPHLRLEQIVFNASVSREREAASGSAGVLNKKVLLEALDLQSRIESSTVLYHPTEGLYTPSSYASKDSSDSSVSISVHDICFLVSGKCLIHTPLDYWNSDINTLASDNDILHTLSNTSIKSSLGAPIPIQSVFGGVVYSKTHPVSLISASSLVITYVLDERRISNLIASISDTISKHDSDDNTFPEEIVSQIWDGLWSSAVAQRNEPLDSVSSDDTWVAWRSFGELQHLYYVFGETSMDDVFSVEYAIVLLSYIIVFFYISLVLGRVELVKSKFGLGMGAVIMVFSSLTMSVGLTSWMGVTSTLVPWEVLPFLIIAIGVENIFVMTNAVVTSSIDLPVRERVGIGLSKVGAKMTSKVFHELCLLVLVSLINVPALQEFCLFATVAVVIDFMMQITFFTTILSIDIRRLELSDLHTLQAIHARQSSKFAKDTGTSLPAESKSQRWGALIMIGIMLSIGLGIYGTSSQTPTPEPYGPMEPPTLPWEATMSATADAIWSTINPNNIDQYVEVRPPVCVTAISLNENTTPQPTDTPHTPSAPPSLKKEKWKITIDGYSFEIPRSLFIILLLGTIVMICLGFIMASSLALYLIRDTTQSLKATTHSQKDSDNNDTQKSTTTTRFQNAQVASLYSGCAFVDVEYLGCASDGTVAWTSGDGNLHFWNCRTARRFVVQDEVMSRTGTGGVSCFKVFGAMLVVGGFSGTIRVFETYSGRLVCELTSGCKSASGIYEVAFELDRLVAVRFDGTLDMWTLPERVWEVGDVVSISPEFTSIFLEDTPSSIFADLSRSIVFGSCQEGSIKRLQLNEKLVDTITHANSSCSSMCFDNELDVLVVASAGGDITISQLSTKKELLFIRAKATASATFTSEQVRQSFESSSSNGSATNNKVSRVGLLLEGHLGEVTFLKIVQKDDSSSDSLSPVESLQSFLIVSAGVDCFVNIWEVSVTKPRISSASVSIHSCYHLHSIHQPGCGVAACFENKLIGVRRQSESAGNLQQTETVRNRRSSSKYTSNEGWWELWVLDLAALPTHTSGDALDENAMSLIKIGDDNLAGIGLGNISNLISRKKSNNIKRALAYSRVSEDDSADDGWENDDAGCGKDVEESDGTEDEAPPLPVLGVDLLVASRWGVVCGFGNYLKVVFIELGNPAEIRRIPSSVMHHSKKHL